MKRIVAIFVIFLLLVMAGCSGETNTEAQDKGKNSKGTSFSLGVATWVGYAPLYIAEEKGIFKKNGIKVDLMKMESNTDRRTALAAKRIQGFASTVDTHVVSAAGDVPAVQVVALDESHGGDGIVAKKEIKSLKDLKGKRVAVQTDGGASFFWFLYLLKEEGIDFKEINAQNMTAGDAGAAFIANKVDAAVTWEPWLTKAKKTEFGSVLATSDISPGVITSTIAMHRDFIKENPEVVRALVKSWFEAVDYYKTNEEDALKIMGKAMGQSTEEIKEALKGVRFYDEEKNKEYFGTKEQPGQIYELSKLSAQFWKDQQLINKEPNIEDLIDYSFIQ
ncbi:ABC transporter substrate-binding protein [Pseudobacillus wudalianchiensis]|uniref:Aliphatic sulfonate ABC transporter substrate-binding protein n=1 Tax=Pseudobacillus wudalianchiensis TaxID=1743143 RepID=A0A1B9AE07_9BACI|nr:ABC transporter substrate-binding protein [Bacillus wudalianchiensis]OCA82065.1 aliphatic sulfonate ABC transporter substrate-binding protein [Bacillus wudalianchiensis]